MRVLIDACVLYPTVLRRLVLGVAEAGVFTPLWSARILEEWARAAARDGPLAEATARGEIAAQRALFPDAEVPPNPSREAELSLPDDNDVHVLAAAISGAADELLTLNTRDFPIRSLGSHGILRRHPDEFLLEVWGSEPDLIGSLLNDIQAAAAADGLALDRRSLLKRARLPRLGKTVAR